MLLFQLDTPGVTAVRYLEVRAMAQRQAEEKKQAEAKAFKVNNVSGYRGITQPKPFNLSQNKSYTTERLRQEQLERERRECKKRIACISQKLTHPPRYLSASDERERKSGSAGPAA